MSASRLTALDDAAWDSPWRHRRCGEKVLLSVGLIVAALVLPPWPTCLLVVLASIALIVGWAKIPAQVLAVAMAAPAVFIVLGAATVAVQVGVHEPTASWRWGMLSVSHSSIMKAASAGAHGLAGTLALMVLATTTPMVDILTWMRRLHIPAPLLEIASLTYRMIFVILDTLVSVHQAQTNRLGYERGMRQRIRSTGTLMGQVLTRSWHRASRLEEGLTLRGDMDQLMTTAQPAQASPVLLGTAIILPLTLIAVNFVVSGGLS